MWQKYPITVKHMPCTIKNFRVSDGRELRRDKLRIFMLLVDGCILY
jgi:hypothetical protein